MWNVAGDGITIKWRERNWYYTNGLKKKNIDKFYCMRFLLLFFGGVDVYLIVYSVIVWNIVRF